MTRTILRVCVCAVVTVALSACDDWEFSNPTGGTSTTTTTTPSSADISTVVSDVLAANTVDHEDSLDYVWDNSEVVPIVFDGTSVSEASGNVTAADGVVTISASGTYRISGSSSNGQVVVDVTDEGTVRLILSGLSISNSSTAPIYVKTAQKAVIILADDTENTVTDGSSYSFADASTNEPNAAVFSTADLTICGSGSLTVQGNCNDGIASKDGLIINGGTLNVTAADDGIRGKDYVVVKSGLVTVVATGDGLKSDNEENPARGYVSVEYGTLDVTAGGDAITAVTDVVVNDGQLSLTSGGGSSHTVTSSVSAKGIKGITCVVIGGGTFAISSADDAIHSNSTVVVHGGTFTIASGDDGIHADSLLGINGGDITITKSYEGLESISVVINDGDIHLVASDDGINGAGGNDGSGMGGWPGTPTAGSASLAINGGYVYVNATGDGLDVNGSVTMTGGTVLVNGPTSSGNGALDYDASFKISGGFLIAAGSSGMAQAPSSSSSQYSTLTTFTTTRSANTIFRIQTGDGTDVVTFKPVKKYQAVVFSGPDLAKGATYKVYLGGSSTGSETDGLYTGGEYSGGTQSTSFTISSVVTSIRS